VSTKIFYGTAICTKVFLSGNSYGLFERIVLSRLPHMSHKIIFCVAVIIAKLIIFQTSDVPLIIVQIMMLVLGIVVDFWRIKEDRGLFEKYHDYREGLTKFQTLMVSGLPVNVLIISRNLQQELFVNDSLKQLVQGNMMRKWLGTLTIDKESFSDGISKVIQGTAASSLLTFEGTSLLEFLEIFRNQELIESDHNLMFNTVYQKDVKQIFQTKVFPLKWDNRDAIAVTFNDVTDHYQNLSLKVADANKDKMLAFISHELRTPLNGILGVVQLLEKRASDIQTIQYLRVCKNSGEMLLSLVNSILDLQHIRDNKFSLKITKGNVHELLQDIYRLFKLQYDQKKVALELDIAPELPLIIGTDHTRLRQVLINLVGNALKFTFEGNVRIWASVALENKGYIVFGVSDTGTGIKEEDKEKLFKMYGKLDQADAGVNTQGIGFGLEISNQLVKLLSDDTGIKVESTYGVGSQFTFFVKDQAIREPFIIKEDDKSRIYEFDEVEGEDEEGEETEDLGLKIESHAFLPSLVNEKARIRLSGLSGRSSVLSGGAQEGLLSKRLQDIHLKLTSTQNSPNLLDSGSESKARLITPISPSSFLEFPASRESRSKSMSYKMGSATTPNIVFGKKQKKERVLIVDDNPFNLLVAKHLVEGLGYFADTVLNGKLAINEIKKGNKLYNVILMDLQMPLMDGFEASRELKVMMENKEIGEIPIIALSANYSDEDKVRCKEIGIYEYVAKPLKEEVLKRVLEDAIREAKIEIKVNDGNDGGSNEHKRFDIGEQTLDEIGN